MYTMFVENYPVKYKTFTEKNVPPVKFDCGIKYRFHFDYFKYHFNYGFGRPRTGVCGEGEKLKLKLDFKK